MPTSKSLKRRGSKSGTTDLLSKVSLQTPEDNMRKKINRRVIDSVKEVSDYLESRSDSSNSQSLTNTSLSDSNATFISELSLIFGQEVSEVSSCSSYNGYSTNSKVRRVIKYKFFDQVKYSQFEKNALLNLKLKQQMQYKMRELFQKKIA